MNYAKGQTVEVMYAGTNGSVSKGSKIVKSVSSRTVTLEDGSKFDERGRQKVVGGRIPSCFYYLK